MTIVDEGGESILQEAQRLTHGDRNADYGHPLDDYTRTAALVSALLAHKLLEPITAAEMAAAMGCVKLSRQMHAPKRDNMVDLAGYAWVSQACIEETARREKLDAVTIASLLAMRDEAVSKAAAIEPEPMPPVAFTECLPASGPKDPNGKPYRK